MFSLRLRLRTSSSHWAECELRTLEGHSDIVYGVALSADGRVAVPASEDQTLKVWEVGSGRELRTLQGHSSAVHGVALSGNGRVAVSASRDRTIRVWELMSGEVVVVFTCDAAARCCAFGGEGTIAAGDEGGNVHFLWLEKGKY